MYVLGSRISREVGKELEEIVMKVDAGSLGQASGVLADALREPGLLAFVEVYAGSMRGFPVMGR
jgi:hypothetical protein